MIAHAKQMPGRFLATGGLALALLAGAGEGSAQVQVISQSPHPIRKLGRGLANTVGGVLEIPLSIREVGFEKGPVAGLTLGLLIGAGAAITRTLVGVIELLTFPLPTGAHGYEPILLPEFILEPGSYTERPAGQ